MPVFNGDDPDEWLFRAERYFALNQLSENEKLLVGVVSFEGKVVHWYRWAKNRRKFRSWTVSKRRLFRRFLPSQHGSLCARFLSIRQEGTVEEYCQRFEEWSAPLPQLSEEVLEDTFTNELDPVIRAEIFCLEPNGLEEMMRMAQKIEARMSAIKETHEFPLTKLQKNSGGPFVSKTTSKPYESTQMRSVTLAEKVPFNKRETPVRRLFDSELQAKRDQHLCYRCDEKFFPGHRCKNRELRVLLTSDDIQDTEMTKIEYEEPNPQSAVEVSPVVELSLNLVVGISTLGTMKLKGNIINRDVVVLIDCGATQFY